MYEFEGARFLRVWGDIEALFLLTAIEGPFGNADVLNDPIMAKHAQELCEHLDRMQFVSSLAAAKRFHLWLSEFKPKAPMNAKELKQRACDLRDRIHDDLEACFWLHLEKDEIDPYSKSLLILGDDVADKLSDVTTDIGEAGKCFGLGRYTACVFHVMRVMEHALNRFGTKINAAMRHDQVWQVILDQVNKAIKAMDPRLPLTKQYAEIAAHLYHVKLAWRNEVMHPKATYTKEEAKEVIEGARLFLRSLVAAL